MSLRPGPAAPPASTEPRLSYVLSVGAAVAANAEQIGSKYDVCWRNKTFFCVDHKSKANQYIVQDIKFEVIRGMPWIIKLKTLILKLNLRQCFMPTYVVDMTGVDKLFHERRHNIKNDNAPMFDELCKLLTYKQVERLGGTDWTASKKFVQCLRNTASTSSTAAKLITDAAGMLSKYKPTNWELSTDGLPGLRDAPGLLETLTIDDMKDDAIALGSAIMHAIAQSIELKRLNSHNSHNASPPDDNCNKSSAD